MTARIPRFRWALALIGGVVAEMGVFAMMPVALRFGPAGPLYLIPPVAFALTFVVGALVAHSATSRYVLHGAVVGFVAAIIYIAITFGQSLPTAYIVAHFLKVLGGMAGGYAIAIRRARVETVDRERRVV
jgi:hypothetical protein